MNYKKIRKDKGFYSYFIAYKLKMNFKEYKEVEKGIKSLSGEKLDLFNNIVNDKGLIIEQIQLVKEARDWQKESEVSNEIKKFGYSIRSIADCLMVSNTYINKINTNGYYSDEILLGLYLFLKDENNKIFDVETQKRKKRTSSKDIINQLKLELENEKNKNKQLINNQNETQTQGERDAYKVLAIRCRAYETLLASYIMR